MLLLQAGAAGVGGVFLIIGLGLRILGAYYCSKNAREKGRDATGWGIFGFISPLIAIIWISCLKSRKVWHTEWDIERNQLDNPGSA